MLRSYKAAFVAYFDADNYYCGFLIDEYANRGDMYAVPFHYVWSFKAGRAMRWS